MMMMIVWKGFASPFYSFQIFVPLTSADKMVDRAGPRLHYSRHLLLLLLSSPSDILEFLFFCSTYRHSNVLSISQSKILEEAAWSGDSRSFAWKIDQESTCYLMFIRFHLPFCLMSGLMSLRRVYTPFDWTGMFVHDSDYDVDILSRELKFVKNKLWSCFNKYRFARLQVQMVFATKHDVFVLTNWETFFTLHLCDFWMLLCANDWSCLNHELMSLLDRYEYVVVFLFLCAAPNCPLGIIKRELFIFMFLFQLKGSVFLVMVQTPRSQDILLNYFVLLNY